MRRFAADVIPGLRLSPTEAPRPWVLPSGATRAERDRLTHLLIQGLRRFDPALQVIQLRWIERRLLSGGRLSLPENTLIWWRVQADGGAPRDARALAQEAESLHGGLHLLDIDGPIVNERLGWLGPLKLAAYYGVIDALHEPKPWPRVEALAEVLNELVTLVLSPLDLLDLAESLIDKSTSGMRPAEARAWALGHHIAARLSPQSAEDSIGCLRAVTERFGGKPLDGEARALWVRAGLLDPEAEDALPIVGTLAEAEVARVAVTQLTLRQHPGRPLKELVPAELLPVERFEIPDLTELMREVSSAPSTAWLAGLSLPEVTPRLSEEEARPIEARLLRALREGRPPSQEDAERAKDVVDVILARVHPHKLSPEETSAELRRAAELAEVMVKDREQRARALLQTAAEALDAGDSDRAQLILDEAGEIYYGGWPSALTNDAALIGALIRQSRRQDMEALQVAQTVRIDLQGDTVQTINWFTSRFIMLRSLIRLGRRLEAKSLIREIIGVNIPADHGEVAIQVANAVIHAGQVLALDGPDEWDELVGEAERRVGFEPTAKLRMEVEHLLLKSDQASSSISESELQRFWLLRDQLWPIQRVRLGVVQIWRAVASKDAHRILELLNIMLDPAERFDWRDERQRLLSLRAKFLALLEPQPQTPE
jgi:hypothetical protein